MSNEHQSRSFELRFKTNLSILIALTLFFFSDNKSSASQAFLAFTNSFPPQPESANSNWQYDLSQAISYIELSRQQFDLEKEAESSIPWSESSFKTWILSVWESLEAMGLNPKPVDNLVVKKMSEAMPHTVRGKTSCGKSPTVISFNSEYFSPNINKYAQKDGYVNATHEAIHALLQSCNLEDIDNLRPSFEISAQLLSLEVLASKYYETINTDPLKAEEYRAAFFVGINSYSFSAYAYSVIEAPIAALAKIKLLKDFYPNLSTDDVVSLLYSMRNDSESLRLYGYEPFRYFSGEVLSDGLVGFCFPENIQPYTQTACLPNHNTRALLHQTKRHKN